MTQEAWNSHWGTEYRRDLREMDLQPLLIELESKQMLGEVIVDVGSGKFPVTSYLRQPHKVILIDIAGEDCIEDNTLRFKKDIETLTDTNAVGTQRTLLRMARFLELDPRVDSAEQVGTIIFSQVLNYVDYQQVLESALKYVKPGGLIIIVNQPGMGFSDLFSLKGIQANSDLFKCLERLGLTVVREVYPWNKNSRQPGERSMVMVVAQKGGLEVPVSPSPIRKTPLSYLRSVVHGLLHAN